MFSGTNHDFWLTEGKKEINKSGGRNKIPEKVNICSTIFPDFILFYFIF